MFSRQRGFPMTARTSLFLVPRRGVLTLCRVEENELVWLVPTSVPPAARYDVSDSGWIAWGYEEGGAVHLTHADAGLDDRPLPPLSLPPYWEVSRLRFVGDRLLVLVLAEKGNDRLAAFDLAGGEPVWDPQAWPALPDGYETGNDLCLYEGRLVAFPRDSFPGFALLTLSGDLRMECRFDFSRRSNSEGGELAAGDHWLAVQTVGWGFGEEVRHIRLFDREHLQCRGALRLAQQESFLVYGGSSRTDPVPTQLAWLGDRLLLACGRHGVGVLDLRSRPDPLPSEQDFGAWCQANLTYRPADGEVLRVLPARDGRALIVLRTSDGQDTWLIDLGP
jgi:hypothetical protein